MAICRTHCRKHLPFQLAAELLPDSSPLLTPVNCAMMAARNCEKAVARNHMPITVLTRNAGVSLVIIDNPTGDRHSSPVVCSKIADE